MTNYDPQKDPVVNGWKPIEEAEIFPCHPYLVYCPEYKSTLTAIFRNDNWYIFGTRDTILKQKVSHIKMKLTTPNDPPNPTRLKELRVLKALVRVEEGHKIDCEKGQTFNGEQRGCDCGTEALFKAKSELLADPTYATFIDELEVGDD